MRRPSVIRNGKSYLTSTSANRSQAGTARRRSAREHGGAAAARRDNEERKMPVSIERSPNGFAGRVTGVDCAAPLRPEDVAAIDAGMETYGVLVFRNQPLSDAQQLAFTLHFGKLEIRDPRRRPQA